MRGNFAVKQVRDYLAPIAWWVVGLSIMSDPSGRVLQMQFGFGEYKYLAGFLFLLAGLLFARQVARRKGRE